VISRLQVLEAALDDYLGRLTAAGPCQPCIQGSCIERAESAAAVGAVVLMQAGTSHTRRRQPPGLQASLACFQSRLPVLQWPQDCPGGLGPCRPERLSPMNAEPLPWSIGPGGGGHGTGAGDQSAPWGSGSAGGALGRPGACRGQRPIQDDPRACEILRGADSPCRIGGAAWGKAGDRRPSPFLPADPWCGGSSPGPTLVPQGWRMAAIGPGAQTAASASGVLAGAASPSGA